MTFKILLQIQPNLAKSIFGCIGINYVQMKGNIGFQGEIVEKQGKYVDNILKNSSPELLGQFQPNFAQFIIVKKSFSGEQYYFPLLWSYPNGGSIQLPFTSSKWY